MNKKELAKATAAKCGCSIKDADTMVTCMLEAITETLVAGEEIKLQGFGNFSVVERGERINTDPRDPSHKIVVPAHKVIKYTVSSVLKNAVK